MRPKAELQEFVADMLGMCDGGHPETGRFSGDPVIGIADPNDPIFEEFRRTVGPEHMTPAEAFAKRFNVVLERGSVVSIVLPIAERIRVSNRPQKDMPSREWAICRAHADKMSADLSMLISERFDKEYKVVVPSHSLSNLVKSETSYSTWSERHIAYAAGLGTFSLNDSFISEVGAAIRLLSFVTDAEIERDVRSHAAFDGNCLFRNGDGCGKCMRRCPAGAISADGHDKGRCKAFVYGNSGAPERYDMVGLPTGCGLCQTGVPCEYLNPRRRV
ncbi:MAG: hypothetical protein LBS92_07420 [Candidatus Methanoplasma sp.]|jgi:epoxyqueuosine reductase QueG|nr:hypothetical protein [Candidatus Methanoplasma sp.]